MLDDDALGMNARISRRDFVNGAAVAVGALGAGLPALGAARAGGLIPQDETYPPSRTGMRGSHPGSFEMAHALRDGQKPGDAQDTGETYDLIIVGGGLSGLAAAHFYRKAVGPQARILILDNHDDFGGHAKRNEYVVDGKSIVINGGTLNIESPERYNKWARSILDDLGIDLERYKVTNDANSRLYAGLGLRRGAACAGRGSAQSSSPARLFRQRPVPTWRGCLRPISQIIWPAWM